MEDRRPKCQIARENGDKSIVLAAVERRKRLSAQNNRVEGSAIAVALQTVAPAPSVPSERPAQLSWIDLGRQRGYPNFVPRAPGGLPS
jgi:hypothetical protein